MDLDGREGVKRWRCWGVDKALHQKGRFLHKKAAHDGLPTGTVETISTISPLPSAGITQFRFQGSPDFRLSEKLPPPAIRAEESPMGGEMSRIFSTCAAADR